MKRIIALFVAFGLICGMALGMAPSADAKTVIKIAGMKPEGEPETIGMHQFGKYLAELSNGKYEVQVFPNSQLGKEDAYIAATRKGIFRCAPPARRPRRCIRPWPCWKRPCSTTIWTMPAVPWKARPLS